MGEKHPELTRGLRLLGGLIYLPMYAYYDGFTCAQIELLTSDAPMVDYNSDKKGKKGRRNSRRGSTEPPRPSKRRVDEVTRKWLAKYGNGQKAQALDLTKYE